MPFTRAEEGTIFFMKSGLMDILYTHPLFISSMGLPIDSKKDVIIAGGVFTSIYYKEKVNDVDIFFLNDIPLPPKGNDYLTLEHKSNDYDSSKIRGIYYIDINLTRFQIIYRTESTREELIRGFDYAHSKISYQNGTLYISPQAYRAVRDKILIPTPGIKISSKRRQKFLERGFRDGI